ncbi:PQQ-binding-like beta-propeller repeat protein [Nocardia higoensis]|uniref:PQQ-binding-like beta-propeller repeat protein n=1 Tax=Nocardia higoensis TaxID=228599 RepID=UPI000315BEF5|nr:PQQ-binding-like beta-propeller repeat protein [Nocardia higoensis]
MTLQVLDWIAIARESGGSCGTSKGISYGDCPRHWGTIFVSSLFGLMAAVPLLVFAVIRSRLGGAAAAVVAAVSAVYPAAVVFGQLHGDTWESAWAAPSDRTEDGETAGIWLGADDADMLPAGPDVLAVAGDTAVALGADTVHGFALRDGAPRRQFRLPESACGDPWLAAGRQVVVAVDRCTGTESADSGPALWALDPATGAVAWTAAVPFEGTRRVTRIAAEPLVLHVAESGKRGRSAFVAFDDTGRVTATVDSDDSESSFSSFDVSGFDAAPVTSPGRSSPGTHSSPPRRPRARPATASSPTTSPPGTGCG